ncbi:amidohydrolase family protein [Abyssalbus ytuae]|uniref:Amidohydrolase family protein n=1 Tax=Abyssalbus ytuae TaxID=2926907 RepID=A0A9E6ZZT0_9FLAO|nr:amidohydrolase family protein [Abyssalbus ytuae]UOB18172.1 amidohydrolase family protein [Abyssalbus ytuae]
MKKSLLALAMFWFTSIISSQEYFPGNSGVNNQNDNYTAFTNAKIYVTPTRVIENGTLLIKNDKVIATGQSVNIPQNSLVVDLKGKYIYPSFIDIYSDFGIKEPQRNRQRNSPQYDAGRSGYYWNDHIMPENNAVEKFEYDKKKAKELIEAGFGTVNTHYQNGIIRGTGVLVTLNKEAGNSARIIDQNAAQHLSFKKSVTSNQKYPTSLMGAIALIKQFYYDSKWYEKGNADTKDLSIEAWLKNKSLPQIFEADDKLNDLRAAKIAKEFNIDYIIKGGGNEFERINEIAATNLKFIIPVAFPEAYDVTDPYAASKLSLADMKMWNQAPSNLKSLTDNGVTFALTLDGLKKTSDFKSNLLKAIQYGFDKTKALEALTTIPASLLNKSNIIGSLKEGSYANFLITSGDLFDKETTLYENWIQGSKHVVKDMNIIDIAGNYELTVGSQKYELGIQGEADKPKSEIKLDTVKIDSKITYKNNWLNIFYKPRSKEKEFVRLTALVNSGENISGKGILDNGNEISWKAIKKTREKDKETTTEEKKEEMPEIFPVTYPNKAYGTISLPQQQNVLFKNATVWTSEKEGVLNNTDVLVKNGKIAGIGKNLPKADNIVIDATGKHLTAGIIDEHSHIATAAVNEAGHNSSAEVTIEDVIDSEDSDIYRNLSGGVTTIQILHGSANPIGGRSAIIKLKWGEDPEDLLFKGAPKFIKFALGENVKQSNWGDDERVRFPQTRMGVEQVYVDYFQRAKEYDAKWKTYNKLSSREKAKNTAPRYDIEMEVLAEIINSERFITCHSYVQSEINMLMKVAEKFGFNVNTFTHILEGYKVADKMKEHGVGGSTFSDWWAYKYEVNDAIPYNAAIMHNVGVTVAINSDDAEMSRRLNQEAAKTIKYGGVSEEEAWKFVTINPAKLLHIDHKTGSIKEGKDADLVLWSDHPLSIYAIAEKTMIEGAFYYDYEQMKKTETQIQNEKNRLINMMIESKNKGMGTQEPKKKDKKHFHCNSLDYQKL